MTEQTAMATVCDSVVEEVGEACVSDIFCTQKQHFLSEHSIVRLVHVCLAVIMERALRKRTKMSVSQPAVYQSLNLYGTFEPAQATISR